MDQVVTQNEACSITLILLSKIKACPLMFVQQGR